MTTTCRRFSTFLLALTLLAPLLLAGCGKTVTRRIDDASITRYAWTGSGEEHVLDVSHGAAEKAAPQRQESLRRI